MSGSLKMVFRIPETITEDEMVRLLKGVRKSHHRLAFALGFYECMRVGEVVRLLPADFDKQTKLLHIKQSKGAKDRMIPVAPEVLRGLKYLPVGCGIRALQIAFKGYSLKVLGKDLHFHCLRHSGITHYVVVKKWSTLEVQRLAGHSKISTTQIYTHVRPDDLVNRMWE